MFMICYSHSLYIMRLIRYLQVLKYSIRMANLCPLPQIISTHQQLPPAHIIRLVRQHAKQLIFQCRFSTAEIVIIKLIDMTHMCLYNCSNDTSINQICLSNYLYSTCNAQTGKNSQQKKMQHIVIYDIPPSQINESQKNINIEGLEQLLLEIAITKIQSSDEDSGYAKSISDFFYGFDGVLYSNTCFYLKQCEISCQQFLAKQLINEGHQNYSKINYPGKQKQLSISQGDNMLLFEASMLNLELIKIKNALEDVFYRGIYIHPLSIQNVAFTFRHKNGQVSNKPTYSGSAHSIDSVSGTPKFQSIITSNSYKAIIKGRVRSKNQESRIYSLCKSSSIKIDEFGSCFYNKILEVQQEQERQINSFISSFFSLNRKERIQNSEIFEAEGFRQKYQSDLDISPHRRSKIVHYPYICSVLKGGPKFNKILKIIKNARIYACGISCKINSLISIQNLVNNFSTNFTGKAQGVDEEFKKWVLLKFQDLQKQSRAQFNSLALRQNLEKYPYQETLILKKHFIEGIKGQKQGRTGKKLIKRDSKDAVHHSKQNRPEMGLGWGELLCAEYRDDASYKDKLKEHLKVYKESPQIGKFRLRFHFYSAKQKEIENKPRFAIEHLKKILDLEKNEDLELSQKQKAVIYHEIGRLLSIIYSSYEEQPVFVQAVSSYESSLKIKRKIYGIYSIRNFTTLYNIIGLYYSKLSYMFPESEQSLQKFRQTYQTVKAYIFELIQIKFHIQKEEIYERWLKAECREDKFILNFILSVQKREQFSFYNPLLLTQVDKNGIIEKCHKNLQMMLANQNSKGNKSKISQINEFRNILKDRKNSKISLLDCSLKIKQKDVEKSENKQIQEISNKSQNLHVLKTYTEYLASQKGNSQKTENMSTKTEHKLKLSFKNRIRLEFLNAHKLLNQKNPELCISQLKQLIGEIEQFLQKYQLLPCYIFELKKMQFYIKDHIYRIQKVLWAEKTDNKEDTRSIDWQWIIDEYYGSKFEDQKQMQTWGGVNEQTIEYILLNIKYRHNFQYVEIILKRLDEIQEVKQFKNLIKQAQKAQSEQINAVNIDQSKEVIDNEEQKESYWHSKDFYMDPQDILAQNEKTSRIILPKQQEQNQIDLLTKYNKKIQQVSETTSHQDNTKIAIIIYLQAICAIQNGHIKEGIQRISLLLDAFHLRLIGDTKNSQVVVENRLLNILREERQVTEQELTDFLLKCRFKEHNTLDFLVLYKNQQERYQKQDGEAIEIGIMLIELCYIIHKKERSNSQREQLSEEPYKNKKNEEIPIDSINFWLIKLKKRLFDAQNSSTQNLLLSTLKGAAILGSTQFLKFLEEFSLFQTKIHVNFSEQISVNQIIFNQLLFDVEMLQSSLQFSESVKTRIVFQTKKVLIEILDAIQEKKQQNRRYCRLVSNKMETVIEIFRDFNQQCLQQSGSLMALLEICTKERGYKAKCTALLLQIITKTMINSIQKQRNNNLDLALSILLLQSFVSLQMNSTMPSSEQQSLMTLKQIVFQPRPLNYPQNLQSIDKLLNSKLSNLFANLNSAKKQYNKILKIYDKMIDSTIEEVDFDEQAEAIQNLIESIQKLQFKYSRVVSRKVYNKVVLPELVRLREEVENGL